MSNQTKTLAVVAVLDGYRVVINAGSLDGIKEKDRFLIYELGEELIDPDSKESLGRLEIIKGTGRPVHIQDKLTTIQSNEVRRQSDRRRIVIKSGGHPMFGLGLGTTPATEEIVEPQEDILESFRTPKVGDRAKKIN
jgi:hypothetical protein